MKDKTLSNKIYEDQKDIEVIWVKDVKDFIQKLKDRIDNPSGEVVCSVRMIHQIIDEEAGDVLTHSSEEKSKRKSFFSSKSSGTHSQQKKIGGSPRGVEALRPKVQNPAGTHGSDIARCANPNHIHGDKTSRVLR